MLLPQQCMPCSIVHLHSPDDCSMYGSKHMHNLQNTGSSLHLPCWSAALLLSYRSRQPRKQQRPTRSRGHGVGCPAGGNGQPPGLFFCSLAMV